MGKKAFALLLAITLSACGKSEPPFPSFTVAELSQLSKNERQELERRCLGISNETCSNLKSNELQGFLNVQISACKKNAELQSLKSDAIEADRKCNNM